MSRLLILLLFPFLLISCGTHKHLITNDLLRPSIEENSSIVISRPINIHNQTISLPPGCTLVFKKNGYIYNGSIKGDNTKLEFSTPFIGQNTQIDGCTISGRKHINDSEVFITVSHLQSEIQTLFNICGGAKITFSKGEYKDIDHIVINNSVNADFSNGIINLKWDSSHVSECFYMPQDGANRVDYVTLSNLKIKGKRSGIREGNQARRCIQLFNVSEVTLDNIHIDEFYAGREEYLEDNSDLQNKTRIGTCSIALFNYDKCVIKNCVTNDINNEIFWCVPANNPSNITYFINNKSYCSSKNGSSSFFTIIDGRCIVKYNEVYNYNGSAFNAFCYNSEISYNKFYDGKRSVAIDLSEGTMYRANNVRVHHNECYNSKGLFEGYGSNLYIKNNKWNGCGNEERTTIVVIRSRGQQKKDSFYIGSDNNPDDITESNNIQIVDNEFIRNNASGDSEIRAARLYGNHIVYSNNKMCYLNMPVVQMVAGSRFTYDHNTILDSFENDYGELLINDCFDANINNNRFSRCFSKSGKIGVIRILKGGGTYVYKDNKISFDNMNGARDYVPCLFEDYSELDEATIICDVNDRKNNANTGIEAHSRIKTNLKK